MEQPQCMVNIREGKYMNDKPKSGDRAYLIVAAICFVTAMGLLWLFAWIYHLIPDGHWASFPFFVTALVTEGVLVVAGKCGAGLYKDSYESRH